MLFLLPYCACAPHPASATAPALPLWPTHPAVAHRARGTGLWLPLLPYMLTTPSVTAVDRHEVYLRRHDSPAATITITTAKYILTTAWFSTSLFSTCTSLYPSTCFTADICFSTTSHLLPQHERIQFFNSINSIMDPEVAERWLVPHKSTSTSKKINLSSLYCRAPEAQLRSSYYIYPRYPRPHTQEHIHEGPGHEPPSTHTHRKKKREQVHGLFLQTAEYPEHCI